MSKVGVLLCFFLSTYHLGSAVPKRNIVVRDFLRRIQRDGLIDKKDLKKKDYETIVRIARAEVGVMEGAVENSGRRVNEYLRYVGIKENASWCAAFVSFVHGKAGFPLPKSGWSPSLFPASRLARDAIPGVVYGIYFPALKRIGHCGIVTEVKGDLVYGVEGNTNVAGSRNGDGVYVRVRNKRTIRAFADWVN